MHENILTRGSSKLTCLFDSETRLQLSMTTERLLQIFICRTVGEVSHKQLFTRHLWRGVLGLVDHVDLCTYSTYNIDDLYHIEIHTCNSNPKAELNSSLYNSDVELMEACMTRTIRHMVIATSAGPLRWYANLLPQVRHDKYWMVALSVR